MKNPLKVFGCALIRACADVIKSESGEFMTTREKSRLLDAMMRDRREREAARAAVRPDSHKPPLTIAHGHSR